MTLPIPPFGFRVIMGLANPLHKRINGTGGNFRKVQVMLFQPVFNLRRTSCGIILDPICYKRLIGHQLAVTQLLLLKKYQKIIVAHQPVFADCLPVNAGYTCDLTVIESFSEKFLNLIVHC